MNQRAERRLLAIRRRVLPAREEAYEDLWAQLGDSVRRDGSHAWRFVSPDDRGSRLEFLEFEATRDPRADAGARRILERLDREIGEGSIEEWLEDR